MESARDKNNSLRFQAIGAIILNVILGGVAPLCGCHGHQSPFPRTSWLVGIRPSPLEIVLNVVFITVSVLTTWTAEEDQLYQEWHGLPRC